MRHLKVSSRPAEVGAADAAGEQHVADEGVPGARLERTPRGRRVAGAVAPQFAAADLHRVAVVQPACRREGLGIGKRTCGFAAAARRSELKSASCEPSVGRPSVRQRAGGAGVVDIACVAICLGVSRAPSRRRAFTRCRRRDRSRRPCAWRRPQTSEQFCWKGVTGMVRWRKLMAANGGDRPQPGQALRAAPASSCARPPGAAPGSHHGASTTGRAASSCAPAARPAAAARAPILGADHALQALLPPAGRSRRQWWRGRTDSPQPGWPGRCQAVARCRRAPRTHRGEIQAGGLRARLEDLGRLLGAATDQVARPSRSSLRLAVLVCILTICMRIIVTGRHLEDQHANFHATASIPRSRCPAGGARHPPRRRPAWTVDDVIAGSGQPTCTPAAQLAPRAAGSTTLLVGASSGPAGEGPTDGIGDALDGDVPGLRLRRRVARRSVWINGPPSGRRRRRSFDPRPFAVQDVADSISGYRAC